MATSTSPNDLTRQQLDELDSLLQRMLALPINTAEPVPVYPPPPPLPELPSAEPRQQLMLNTGWRADAPLAVAKMPYQVSPVEALAAIPAAAVPSPTFVPYPDAPAVRPASQPVPATPYEPENRPGTLRGVDAPAMPFGYQHDYESPVRDHAGIAESDAVSAFDVNPFSMHFPVVDQKKQVRQKSSMPMVLWPFFTLNWVIEFVLGWFGPIGHVLTRPVVKSLLGWLGVLLFVAAGAWAARGMGWVSWPRL